MIDVSLFVCLFVLVVLYFYFDCALLLFADSILIIRVIIETETSAGFSLCVIRFILNANKSLFDKCNRISLIARVLFVAKHF